MCVRRRRTGVCGAFPLLPCQECEGVVDALLEDLFDEVVAASFRDGDDPAIVAKVIVTAATDQKPKLRYPAGPTAGRVSVLRRIVPARAFDKSIRKLNRMAG